MLFNMLIELSWLFERAKIDGPDPEIPEAIAPESIEIFLIDSNSGIKIDLSGSTT